MKNKIKWLLLCAITAFSFVLVSNQAECNAVNSNSSCYKVNTEDNLQHAINVSNKGDSIVITGNILLSRKLEIPSDKDLTISNDGQSRMIQRGNDYYIDAMIVIYKGATLTLRSIGGTDENPMLIIDGNGDRIDSHRSIVINSGTFNMNTGVSLQNNKIDYYKIGYRDKEGCAVTCYKGSKFNITGGKISNNQVPWSLTDHPSYSPAIIHCSENSNIYLSGGQIINNSCHTIIRAIETEAFKMSGGNIVKNNAVNGIVLDHGSLNISGGNISDNDNNENYVRGVYLACGKFNMSGGNIYKNHIGVYLAYGRFNMSGGSISENNVGVYSWFGSFLIPSGGSITKNEYGVMLNSELYSSHYGLEVYNTESCRKSIYNNKYDIEKWNRFYAPSPQSLKLRSS